MSLIPHSPFGGGMRATQNSKLGTKKSLSNLDMAQKILSLVLPTMTPAFCLYFRRRTDQDFNQVVISRDCCFRSKSASKICHRYLSGKSSQKHTGLFGRTLYNSKPLLYMMLIFVSPIFGIGLPSL